MNIPIAFSSDNNFAPFLCVGIYSLLKNSNKQHTYDIYILDGGISQNNKTKIINTIKKFKNKKITFIKMDRKIFKYIKPTSRLNQSAYYRLILPEILPKIGRIIYLDSDILILKDISKLYKEQLGSKVIACCQEFRPNYESSLKMANPKVKFNKVINTGVMLMNLSELNKGKYTKTFTKFAKNNSAKLIAADQDIINIFLTNKIKIIHPKWNSSSHLFLINNHKKCNLPQKLFYTCINNPHIVHFTGIKPWNEGSSHPYKKLFFKYLKETEFKKCKIKFNFKKYIKNKTFFVGMKITNFLPKKVYNLIEEKEILYRLNTCKL